MAITPLKQGQRGRDDLEDRQASYDRLINRLGGKEPSAWGGSLPDKYKGVQRDPTPNKRSQEFQARRDRSIEQKQQKARAQRSQAERIREVNRQNNEPSQGFGPGPSSPTLQTQPTSDPARTVQQQPFQIQPQQIGGLLSLLSGLGQGGGFGGGGFGGQQSFATQQTPFMQRPQQFSPWGGGYGGGYGSPMSFGRSPFMSGGFGGGFGGGSPFMQTRRPMGTMRPQPQAQTQFGGGGGMSPRRMFDFGGGGYG